MVPHFTPKDYGAFQFAILLMEEIVHHLGCIKPVVNNEINYQPQLVLAGFLNHQQYVEFLGESIHSTLVMLPVVLLLLGVLGVFVLGYENLR